MQNLPMSFRVIRNFLQVPLQGAQDAFRGSREKCGLVAGSIQRISEELQKKFQEIPGGDHADEFFAFDKWIHACF